MRALLQRVKHASVEVDKKIVGNIDTGLLVFLGVYHNDTEAQANKLLHKVFNYRIFADDNQKMNLSVKDIAGGLLIVSQFTLVAGTQKGLRPGFSTAASGEKASALYQHFIQQAKQLSLENNNTIQTGIFGADMQVSLVNDGPVTFIIDT